MTAATDAVWLAFVPAAAGTFALRASFVVLFGYLEAMPPGVEDLLQYVLAAVLAALVAPSLAFVGDALVISAENYRLVAGGVAAVVAWRTEGMLATLAAGMVTLWTLEYPG